MGGIVAKDRQTALRAAKLVKVHYEDIQPALMTIQVHYHIDENSY